MPASLPIVESHESATHELPTVRALERVWSEVASKPLWAPPRFWRYLKLRWRTRLRLLDPSRVTLAAQPGKVNDCGACTDICCVGPHSTVSLRLRDIATLIDLGRADLIGHDKPGFSPEELRARPALARQVESTAWRVFPVMRQNHYGACEALTGDGKCSLYPNWPLSCARFPYSLHADDEEVFYSRRCDSFWIRPDARRHINRMHVAAVTAYNERIKDLVLLEYAPSRLRELGLLAYLGG